MEIDERQFLGAMQLLCLNMDHNFCISRLEVEWPQCQTIVVHSINHFAKNCIKVIVRLHLAVELQRLELQVLVLYSQSLDRVLLDAHDSLCIGHSLESSFDQWKSIPVGIDAALFLKHTAESSHAPVYSVPKCFLKSIVSSRMTVSQIRLNTYNMEIATW